MSKEEIYRDFYETIKERVESGLPIWKEALLDCIKENEAALKEVEKEQPKLTIPKKIAEQADKTDFYLLFREGQEEFYQWFDHEHDEYKEVIYAYLAGRAIGVELVEVTDD